MLICLFAFIFFEILFACFKNFCYLCSVLVVTFLTNLVQNYNFFLKAPTLLLFFFVNLNKSKFNLKNSTF